LVHGLPARPPRTEGRGGDKQAPGETLDSSQDAARGHAAAQRTQQWRTWARSAVFTAAASRFLPV